MLFHITMTHSEDNCPAYNREKMPEVLNAFDAETGEFLSVAAEHEERVVDRQAETKHGDDVAGVRVDVDNCRDAAERGKREDDAEDAHHDEEKAAGGGLDVAYRVAARQGHGAGPGGQEAQPNREEASDGPLALKTGLSSTHTSASAWRRRGRGPPPFLRAGRCDVGVSARFSGVGGAWAIPRPTSRFSEG